MLRLFVLPVCYLAFVLSAKCGKDDTLVTGRWKNLTGLDGCGWVIEFNRDGVKETIIPLNYKEFGIEPVDGKPVRVRFETDPQPNICMAANTARLLELKE